MPILRRRAAGDSHQLTMNELKPTLHLAGCFHFHRDVWFQYRLPSHQLMLIESGRIKAETEDGVLHAGRGRFDLLPARGLDSLRRPRAGVVLSGARRVRRPAATPADALPGRRGAAAGARLAGRIV